MKARFEVRSIKAQWKPPFKKEITDEVFDVDMGSSFDKIIGNGNNASVFRLISYNNCSAEIEYSKLFTLKTGNPNKYVIRIEKEQTIDMAYLWGEDGVTKKITYKGITNEESKKNENIEEIENGVEQEDNIEQNEKQEENKQETNNIEQNKQEDNNIGQESNDDINNITENKNRIEKEI